MIPARSFILKIAEGYRAKARFVKAEHPKAAARYHAIADRLVAMDDADVMNASEVAA